MSAKQLGGNARGRKALDQNREELSVLRRGRRAELTDEQLCNRRDQFAMEFDSAWGYIGWELSRCPEPNELVRVFDSLPDKGEGDLFSIFRRPSSEAPNSKKFRELLSIRRSLGEPSYSVEQSKREVSEMLQQGTLALNIGTK